jgi:hypothetical protein
LLVRRFEAGNDVLAQSQIDFFQQNGYLRLEQVYAPAEMELLRRDLDLVMQANREAIPMGIPVLQQYSAAWLHAITKPGLAEDVAALLGSQAVEILHNTLYVKGRETGPPPPMHQEMASELDEDAPYVDALIHVDDADEESGCLKFLAGSHRLGRLAHISGQATAPHLPTDLYRLENAVSVPARAGDVIVFHLLAVHTSLVNRSGRSRRLVRVGFRDPLDRPRGGPAPEQPGLIVYGVHPRGEGFEA